MTAEQNTEALKKARAFSDNKDKIDGFYNGYVQATIELEKENAELKSGCGMCYRKDKEQLTKAKEYIKLLLMNCVGVYESTGKTVAEIQAEAEQFLKECEK